MFKRVERKRKRREEEDELGLDQVTKETLGLNDTDSDESDSDLESAQPDDTDIGETGEQEENAASDEEGVNEDPPISVAEALKDPVYLISLDPTPVHGCVLCKGKLIKNAGMAAVHKNSNAHNRRFEHFKLLSANANPGSNAWELVEAIRSTSNIQRVESQGLSKRALKRQVKQTAIREKRKHHKELKAKAIVKKALKKVSTADEARLFTLSKVDSQSSAVSQDQPRKTRKKQKVESKISTGTIMETTRSASRTKTSGNNKKSDLKSRLGSRRKAKRAIII